MSDRCIRILHGPAPVVTEASAHPSRWGQFRTPSRPDVRRVIPISTATNAALTDLDRYLRGTPGAALTPADGMVYIVKNFENAVVPISTATGTVGSQIPVGTDPDAVAITPDQASAASFTAAGDAAASGTVLTRRRRRPGQSRRSDGTSTTGDDEYQQPGHPPQLREAGAVPVDADGDRPDGVVRACATLRLTP